MNVFFFGCWNEPGHFLWQPNCRWLPSGKRGIDVVDGIHLDGNYAPRQGFRGKVQDQLCWSAQGATPEDRQRLHDNSKERPQGQFLRHERGGYTLLAWWDRTQGDTRGGGNSTILVAGSRTTEEMLAALTAHFPHVVANLKKAGVVLVEAPL